MTQPRPIHEIEKKWQDAWEKEGVYRATDQPTESMEKFYGLVEFPYPSGDGLHVGHTRSYTALDVFTRKKRMEGKNVLYPMGWDAFGLPAENFAIKTKTPPAAVTQKNIANFKRQMQSVGLGFDWSREVDTTDPKYYKWTQWQFQQFFKAGLAFKQKSTINWCPKDKIGLANEEAQGGICERCGTPVEKREKEQWMIGITKYAERLLKDLDGVDYLDKIKAQQVNWIGKSEGAKITFFVPGQSKEHAITVFTTRPDTLFGATFLVVSPETAKMWMNVGWKPEQSIKDYIEKALTRTEQDRVAEGKEKTGVAAGFNVMNPATEKEIPVWIADYVLGNYGTGAIMAVPAHDERDFEFAKKHELPIREVVADNGAATGPVAAAPYDARLLSARHKESASAPPVAYTNDGVSINSEFLNGLKTSEAKQKMVEWLEKEKIGQRHVTYKLRDWVFSRQRYWGEPIPLVHCDSCGKKKQKVLLIHGLASSAELNWLPWMKAELERRGFEVLVPTMTTSRLPVFESWMDELKPYLEQLGEEDVVMGHSLGGRAALHLLAQAKKKIKHVFLVAPALYEGENRDWDSFRKAWGGKNVEAIIEHLKIFTDHVIDWEAAARVTEGRTVIFSDNDTLCPPRTHASLPAGWFVQMLTQKDHFDGKQYPELLQLVLEQRNTGWIPVPEEQLPITLPAVDAYEPSDDGESPLAKIDAWVNTTCPRCGGPAKRETDTMPNWAGSSWYFLRYCDPKNEQQFASPEKLKYWMPVDLYNGGMEHTTLHLLYSRFWHKFLWDMGHIPFECGSEPYRARRSHGLILAEGGAKMSKSVGNVVNPDDVVAKYGADAFRMYQMFMGPFDQAVPWDMNGIEGVKRFLDKVWNLLSPNVGAPLAGAHSDNDAHSDRVGTRPTPTGLSDIDFLYHQTIRKITDGIEQLQFNTCVSQLMILVNGLQDAGGIPQDMRDGFLKLLAPFAPHLAEELWHELGHEASIHRSSWPTYDAAKLQTATFELVVQVNGKVRDRLSVESGITEQEAIVKALASDKIQSWLEGKTPSKTLYVPGKLVNIVLS